MGKGAHQIVKLLLLVLLISPKFDYVPSLIDDIIQKILAYGLFYICIYEFFLPTIEYIAYIHIGHNGGRLFRGIFDAHPAT
jgi:hypothetical protein